MSRDDGGESGTVGSALISIVKRLFRWASADESASGSTSSVEDGSSSVSTQLVESDLNGNVSDACRIGSDMHGDITANVTINSSCYRRSLDHHHHGDADACCRRCGVVIEALKYETTSDDVRSTFVCVRCRKLMDVDRRNSRRLSVYHVDHGERRLVMNGDGEPVCCCDRCATVSPSLLRLPSTDEFLSKSDLYSSASAFLVPSTSLPTSMLPSRGLFSASKSPMQRRRLQTSRVPDATGSGFVNDDPLRCLTESFGEINKLAGDQRTHHSVTVCQPPVADLPPSISVSPDGEEGYLAYSRCLAVRNQAVRDSEASLTNGRAPPNVTVRHLTDREKLTNLDFSVDCY